jgi:hypothetical protein
MLAPFAEEIAHQTKKRVRLVRYVEAEVLEVYEP